MDDLTSLVRAQLPAWWLPPKPQPARKPPASTVGPDNTGWAVLSGRTGQVIELNLTYSASFSRSMEQEKERMVDKVRVKQMTPNPATGKQEVSEENYIDVSVPKEILMVRANGEESVQRYAPFIEAPNVEPLKYDVKEENKRYIDPDITPPGTVGLVGTVKINRRPIRRR